MTLKAFLIFLGCMVLSVNAFALKLTSSAFRSFHRIPATYTCKGDDISPPLKWTNIPAGTESYVLTLDDPDAAHGNWDHWVLFNIPVDISSLDENLQVLPNGAKLGQNSWGKVAYGGPCPPKGKHRYVFTLYALNTTLSLPTGSDKATVLAKLTPDVVVAKAKLVGVFSARP